jgi:hypothetical protein
VSFGAFLDIQAAVDFTTLPIEVKDCGEGSGLDVFIPDAPFSASPRAQIVLTSPSPICGVGLPGMVKVRASSPVDIELIGYSNGASIGMQQILGGQGSDEVMFSSISGIERIEIIGSNICIHEICTWCLALSQGGGCEDPATYFNMPANGLHQIWLGPVSITEARDQNGNPVPLSVQDSDRVPGDMEVVVHWSEATAQPPARINFVDTCQALLPDFIHIAFEQGGPDNVTWQALEINGAAIPGVFHNGPSTAILSHPGGIAAVEIIGSDICITNICWTCQDPPPEVEIEKADPVARVDGIVITWKAMTSVYRVEVIEVDGTSYAEANHPTAPISQGQIVVHRRC